MSAPCFTLRGSTRHQESGHAGSDGNGFERSRGREALMGKTKPSLAQQLASKLESHGDERVKNLVADGELDARIMGELLAQYVTAQDAQDLDLRYLSQGRSGAKVLLLVSPNRQPRVIKFATSQDIKKEVSNYQSTEVKELINSRYRPELDDKGKVVRNYRSLAYDYAGGGSSTTQTLRNAFQELTEETLTGCIWDLLSGLKQWHRVRQCSQLPFGQWTWRPERRKAAQNILRNYGSPSGSNTEMINSLLQVLEGKVGDWRNALVGKRSSRAICHGDMNCDNILIVSTTTGRFPVIIDFGNVKSDWSAACDGAKIERDIKVRCLRKTAQSSEDYRKMLNQLGEALILGSKPTNTGPEMGKAFSAIQMIRNHCKQLCYVPSEIPMVEYAYFLLCWTLDYFASDEYQKECRTQLPEYTTAVVDAAHQAYREVVEAVKESLQGITFGNIPLVEVKRKRQKVCK